MPKSTSKLTDSYTGKSKEWIDGYLEALFDWAWWKDGIMYVGSGNRTYSEIKSNLLEDNPSYGETSHAKQI